MNNKKKSSPQGRGGNKHINNRPHSIITSVVLYSRTSFFFLPQDQQCIIAQTSSPTLCEVGKLHIRSQKSKTRYLNELRYLLVCYTFNGSCGKRKGREGSEGKSVCRKKEPPEAYISAFFSPPTPPNTSCLVRFQCKGAILWTQHSRHHLAQVRHSCPQPIGKSTPLLNKKQDITKWRTRPLKPACVRNCTREMQQEGL